MTEATQEDKVTIRPNIERYASSRSASGSKTKHTNDEVSKALEGATLEEVKTVATGLKVEDVNKYDKLNPGQIRMNLGNRIRGAVNKMDKDKEGSGLAALKNASGKIRKAVDARIKQAEKEAAAKAKAAEAAKAKKKAA